MGPYFRARWYVDHDGLLQRRPAADQQSMEDRLVNEGAAPEDVFPDAAHWSAEAAALTAPLAAPLAGQTTTDEEG